MIKRVFVLILCLMNLNAAQAQETGGEPLHPTMPFAPYLTINENPLICSAYQQAWIEVYKTDAPLIDSAIDLEKAFPRAKHIAPVNGKANAGYIRHSDIEFDYDGDGEENEILYIESQERGWRYLGMGFYLYDTRDDFDSDVQFEHVSSVHGDARFSQGKPKESKAKTLAAYPKLRRAAVFQIEGRLYAQSNVSLLGASPNKASLDWITSDEPPKPICEVSFKPAVNVSPDLDILGPLSQIYGNRKTGGMCYGTMGFTALPISAHIPDILYRPQAMGFRYARTSQAHLETDTARELRFIAWGLSDPSSFKIIRDLKSHYPKFIEDFTAYYRLYHSMNEAQAKDMAGRAYRHLLDNVYYARQSGPQIYVEYFDELDLAPHMSLEEIASATVDKALEKKDGHPQILALGMMADLDSARLKKLTALVLDLRTRYGDNYKPGMEDSVIQSLFLTASRHPQMRDHFLKLGAKPDLPTNYFGKTALMYAAQNNDLNAVIALLSYKADPNTKTQVVNPSCENTALRRDSRTALMYAAENADLTLLLTLIEAGADTAAKDSEGNDVAWYLERNKTLSLQRIEKTQSRLRTE